MAIALLFAGSWLLIGMGLRPRGWSLVIYLMGLGLITSFGLAISFFTTTLATAKPPEPEPEVIPSDHPGPIPHPDLPRELASWNDRSTMSVLIDPSSSGFSINGENVSDEALMERLRQEKPFTLRLISSEGVTAAFRAEASAIIRWAHRIGVQQIILDPGT